MGSNKELKRAVCPDNQESTYKNKSEQSSIKNQHTKTNRNSSPYIQLKEIKKAAKRTFK